MSPASLSPRTDRRRRSVAFVLAACLVCAAVAGLTQGLAACRPHGGTDSGRPLSTAEAGQLAAMRLTNYRDGRAAFRATIGSRGSELRLAGWLDWRRPVAYFAVEAAGRTTGAKAFGPATSATTGLVQAVPGLLATRTDPGPRKDTPTPTNRASTPTPPSKSRNAVPTPTSGKTLPGIGKTTPTPKNEKIIPTPQNGKTIPTPHNGKTIAAPHGGRTTPPGGTGRPAPSANTHAPDGIKHTPTPARQPSAVFGGTVTRPALPPTIPPRDGWRVRRMTFTGEDRSPLDSFAVLLFTIASRHADDAGRLRQSDARWLRHDSIDGIPVEVLLGPAVPPAAPAPAGSTKAKPSTPRSTMTPRATQPRPARGDRPAVPTAPGRSRSSTPVPTTPSQTPTPTSLAAMGGAVRYWLDSAARLHRLEALLGADLPVRLDLDRTSKPGFPAIDAFGGRPIAPATLSVAQARALAAVLPRNWATGGGRLALTMPLPDGGTDRATGWLDWRRNAAYLAVTGTGRDGALVWADRSGIASHSAVKGRKALPLPAPRGGWTFRSWRARGISDLGFMLAEAVRLAGPQPGNAETVRTTAVLLRRDALAGGPVAVYELPTRAERKLPRGNARLRYWIDRDGVLRRLEVRTQTGAFAQLDVTPARLPTLGSPGL